MYTVRRSPRQMSPSTPVRAVLALLLGAALSSRAEAQGGLLFQGVTDLELWKTDSASGLVARNNGHPGIAARADVWSAFEPIRNLVFFAEGTVQAGPLRDQRADGKFVKQAAVRYSPSDAITIEAGKLRPIVGTFASRQLSFRNPLVGTPDGYATSYPYGGRIDGSAGIVDYRAGVVSLPLYRPGYVPDPGSAMRPAVGFGITPVVGVRFGMSATKGAYLNDELGYAMPAGKDWRDYRQSIVAADAQVSWGYFEGHAELAHSVYDIEKRTPIKGLLYYLEPKYTLTPRLFIAGRYERNDYPFILPVNTNFWVANRVVFQDVELGAGYRVGATTLLKAGVRADHWAPNDNPQAPHANGYSLAVQWSQTYDFLDLVTRKQ
ncbi:MAG: hypothetical protein JWM95_984 [Gemmatimonadetes bacterium]|nr:hypothetical protein [Gemmatimonadota bacterium]